MCHCFRLSEEFDGFEEDVHVDEKWFFLTEKDLFIYLVPGEKPPYRSVRHKSHILKVMFLCATARTCFDRYGNLQFDGKIGIWPFTIQVVAQRSSRNHPRGTIETKPLNVTREVYRDYMIQKVLPAIRAKWPDQRMKRVRIQQDGAKTHIGQNNPAFVQAALQDG